MKTKKNNHAFEIAIGAGLMILFLMMVMQTCNNMAQAQGYGVPLKTEYESQNIQNEFDRLWNFVTELNVSDFGSATFDTSSYYDTIYTNFKFDTILHVDITFDTLSNVAGHEQLGSWIETLSDSSVIVKRHPRKAFTVYSKYTWQVSGRLKKP